MGMRSPDGVNSEGCITIISGQHYYRYKEVCSNFELSILDDRRIELFKSFYASAHGQVCRRPYVFRLSVRECVIPCVRPVGVIPYEPMHGASPNLG